GVQTCALPISVILLIFIVFARSWYHSAMGNFYAFYVIDKYEASIANAQLFIFIFLFMGAIGTFLGGPIADRFGKKNVIVLSLLGPAPFALLLPYVGYQLALVLL